MRSPGLTSKRVLSAVNDERIPTGGVAEKILYSFPSRKIYVGAAPALTNEQRPVRRSVSNKSTVEKFSPLCDSKTVLRSSNITDFLVPAASIFSKNSEDSRDAVAAPMPLPIPSHKSA